VNWHLFNLDISTIDPAFGKSKIFKNDVNLKPDWVEQPAENTEFNEI